MSDFTDVPTMAQVLGRPLDFSAEASWEDIRLPLFGYDFSCLDVTDQPGVSVMGIGFTVPAVPEFDDLFDLISPYREDRVPVSLHAGPFKVQYADLGMWSLLFINGQPVRGALSVIGEVDQVGYSPWVGIARHCALRTRALQLWVPAAEEDEPSDFIGYVERLAMVGVGEPRWAVVMENPDSYGICAPWAIEVNAGWGHVTSMRFLSGPGALQFGMGSGPWPRPGAN